MAMPILAMLPLKVPRPCRAPWWIYLRRAVFLCDGLFVFTNDKSLNSMDRQKESVQTCLLGGFNFNHLEKY